MEHFKQVLHRYHPLKIKTKMAKRKRKQRLNHIEGFKRGRGRSIIGPKTLMLKKTKLKLGKKGPKHIHKTI